MRKYHRWVGNLVSDYTVLSTLIINKEFPMPYYLAIDSYEEWRIKRSATPLAANDTLAIIRGILDARKHYKPQKFFWPTFAGATVLMLPGGVIGVSKMQKAYRHFDSIEVPNVNATYFNDEKYKQGYRAGVMAKNQKAVDRAMVWGTLAGGAVLVALVL